MKRFARILHGLMSTSLILLAVSAWPSDGWTQTAGDACVQGLLNTWAQALEAGKPENVVLLYNSSDAVLLPTCENGPYIGKEMIEAYFKTFLKKEPVVTFDPLTRLSGGDCPSNFFVSGLYTFRLRASGGQRLRARYTFIFQQRLIKQHHSSLEPESTSKCP